MSDSADQNFQPDAPDKVYSHVHISDHARAIIGDSHYHIRIQSEQLETDTFLDFVDTDEIKAVSTQAWKLYKSTKADREAFNNISPDLNSLRAVLEECEEVLPQLTQPLQRAQRLRTIISGCEDALGQLEVIVAKFEGLAVRQKWTWARMNTCSVELQQIRARITSHMSLLTAFMSTSQLYVEQRLEHMKRQFQEGHLEGSVISALTVNSLTDNARSEWRNIRKELENHGITLDMFNANKIFIYHWLERALATGAFEEDIGVEEDHEYVYGQDFNHDAMSACSTRRSTPRDLESALVDAEDAESPLNMYDESKSQSEITTSSTDYREFTSSEKRAIKNCILDRHTPSAALLERSSSLKWLSFPITTTKSPASIQKDLILWLRQYKFQYIRFPAGLLCYRLPVSIPKTDCVFLGNARRNEMTPYVEVIFEIAIVKCFLSRCHGIKFTKLQGSGPLYWIMKARICKDFPKLSDIYQQHGFTTYITAVSEIRNSARNDRYQSRGKDLRG